MQPGHQTIPAEPVRNSLCRALGHAWSATTADNYRRCQRLHCHAVQRLRASRWVTVTAAAPRAQTTRPTHSQQPLLWNGDVPPPSPPAELS